jgi:DNA-binding transcriptional ArsR family regulator
MDLFLTVIRALSHEDRVRIIKLLQFASLTFSELAEILGQSESEVQDHVSVLKDADVLMTTDGDRGEILHINPDRTNLYGAVILALLDGWLNDDTRIQEDRRRAERILGDGPS